MILIPTTYDILTALEKIDFLTDLPLERVKGIPLEASETREGVAVELEKVKIEQLELGYKLEQKQLELLNKINATIEQLRASFDQLNIQKQMLTNYQTLFAAENEKFRIGESSVFLLNTREQKLIAGQLKLIKLQTYCQLLWTKLLWAQGQLR